MYIRPAFLKIATHIDKKQITVLTGLRRVGKTTALKYLLEQTPSANKVFIDLERIDNRLLFEQQSMDAIEAGLRALGISLTEKAYIAIDEIQLVPSITSVIKYLYDTHDIKFYVSGSSSFYIKNRFTESLAGRKRIFEMYPLNFGEYLQFNEVKTPINTGGLEPFNATLYSKLHQHYKRFLYFGGFPEVVLAPDDETRTEYLKDIVNAYIELDVKLLGDFNVSHDLYKLCQLMAVRCGSKTDNSKLSSISGLNRHKVKEYLELMEHTCFLLPVSAFTSNKDKEISLQKKYYLADNGLLNTLAKPSQGQLLENAVAASLWPQGTVQYYAKKTGQEIDFILNGETGMEVKETATEADKKILTKRSTDLGLKSCYLTAAHPGNSGYTDFVWSAML